MQTTIWINAGETSGDLHGQLLAQALRATIPDLRLVGMAGPAMRAEGVEPLLTTEELSVMGFTEVLGKIPAILSMLRAIKTHLQALRPAAVIVIDAPDFHFRVAKIAKALGIPVFYYISPKLWAWREGRVQFLRTHINRLISILPFEVEFYRRHGLDIDYVGHPLLDAVRTPEVLQIPSVPNRIGILPGSRKREITTLLPLFARTATLLASKFPDLEFVLPVAPGVDQNLIRACWQSSQPITLTPGETRYATMRSCRAIMAASGTATLETALLEIPTAVAYKFSTLSFLLGTLLVKVPYISLPNLILGAPVFPEFLQHDAEPAAIAAQMAQWIEDSPARAHMQHCLATLPALLGGGGATARAAAIILQYIQDNRP